MGAESRISHWRNRGWQYRLDGSSGAPDNVRERLNGQLRPEFLLEAYFRAGTVKGVLGHYKKEQPPYGLPISEVDYHRLLTREGVVKSAGRHNELPYGLLVLEKLLEYAFMPVETFYREIVPLSIKEVISQSGLWRMVRAIKENTTRLHGTALVITPEGNRGQVLVARDMIVNRPELGKPGDLTVPMTYSKWNEGEDIRIRRVIQQEMLTRVVIDRQFLSDLRQFKPERMGVLSVADVRAEVYHLVVPGEMNFSSFKLDGHHFMRVADLVEQPPIGNGIRAGVVEMAQMYIGWLEQPTVLPERTAELNLQLAAALA